MCIAAGLIVVACNQSGSYKKLSPAAARQARLDWNLKTLVEAYKTKGNTDPAWDEPARLALTEFARVRSQSLESDESWWEIIATNCAEAIKYHCDDPMIAYLYNRFSLSQPSNPKALTDVFCKAAQDMQQSSYPSIRKFYAWQRAGDQVSYTYGYGQDIPPDILRMGIWQQAETDFLDAISDKTMPPEEAYDASHEILEIWRGDNDHYNNLYQSIEKQTLSHGSGDPVFLLLKGEVYTDKAWQARGSGYADTITKEGGKLFKQDLALAAKALTKAWRLNPNDVRIPLQMLTVELGQGEGREQMELWFKRAMALDANDYDACLKKLTYLEPKWYGSADNMLNFGRECVENKDWGGRVPMILPVAHDRIYSQYIDKSEQANYWKQPEVWPDIQAAFDRFFELNPEAIGWYHNYAWYAYHSEQWNKLNELIPKLGTVNYKYFGGEDEFNKMLRLAEEHASKPK
jgi:hypothetical protein